MSVYDAEKNNKRPDAPLVPSDTAAAQKGSTAPGSGGSKELAQREKGYFNPEGTDKAKQGGADKGSAAASGASEKGSGTNSKTSESSRMGRIVQKIKEKRKQAILGGTLTAGGLAAIFGLGSVASGPFQAIHPGQLLQGIHGGRADSFGDGRTAKFLLYALAGKTAKGRLGIIQNVRADTWEKRLNEKAGLKSVYSKPPIQRLIGYQILDESKASEAVKEMEKAGTTRSGTADGVDINGNPIRGSGNYIGTSDDKFSTRRAVSRLAVKSIGVNKVSSTLGARLLIKRGGVDFHPLKNVVRKQADKYADYRRERQEDLARQNETGRVGAPGSPDAESPTSSKRKENLTKLKTLANTAKGPALAVAASCVLKEFSGSIDDMNLENQQQTLRLGASAVTIAAQVQSGKGTNLDEVGAYVGLLNDTKTGTSFTDDAGIQQGIGQDGSGVDKVPYDVKPGSVDKFFIFDVADTIIVGPLAFACDLIAGVAQWGPFQVLSDASEFIIDGLLYPFGLTSKGLMDDAIAFFSSGAPNLLAAGAERGGLANIGYRMAINSQFIAGGGSELTPEQGDAVLKTVRAEQAETFANASIYDRYFNLYESRSAMATMAAAVPTNRAQFMATINNIPRSFIASLSSLVGMNKVSAAIEPYQYTFPLYGYTLEEMNDPAYANPYENEDYIMEDPDRLNRMNEEYGQPCFDMSVSKEGVLTYGEAKDFTLIEEKCKDRSNTELTHYRFYLADMITGLSLDCYEGNEEACGQLGMEGGKPANAAPAPVIGDGNVVIGDTSNLTCGAGTDAGIGDGYAEGVLYKTRLCTVQGITVNAQIAFNVDQLLTAAKAAGAGITGGGGFRSMEQQRATRAANRCQGDSGPCSGLKTAAAGFSNHQMGLAIDFNDSSGTVCIPNSAANCTGNAAFDWLKANAATYGLKNLPAEAWHWSYNGN